MSYKTRENSILVTRTPSDVQIIYVLAFKS